ncbi:hypothetical protein ACZ87_00416 [Candidatus Erwinia dacicola]|uniref:Uncharacterized protein n=1 Tax=Candidatus Erwinia dacicola TaxID=252393 RepID=A0A328TYB7_9GAMM|nr:hypothetical protein ACZ87_00416 [Candidatus Erwinia dacicola]
MPASQNQRRQPAGLTGADFAMIVTLSHRDFAGYTTTLFFSSTAISLSDLSIYAS